MTITTINPYTGKVIETYPEMTAKEVENIISQCHQDYLTWSQSKVEDRSQKMLYLANLLRKNMTYYAKLIAEEMGKPVSYGESEIEKCAWTCEYYAKQTESFLQPKLIPTDSQKSYVTYEPLGIIVAIMPWNFPFWQVIRFAAPNLMAGNGCLLKHAQNTTGCALEIEKIIREAEFPKNIFRTLVIKSNQVASIIAHPAVAGVTITGSESAGRAVAYEAGKHLKKVVLELGGNDPYVILEDADLENAAKLCIQSRLHNSGQVCIAAKRMIAVDPVYQKFQQLLEEHSKNYVLGNPLDKKTAMGPLAREDLRTTVHEQIKQAVKQGAKLIFGGEIPKGKGSFYPITLLVDVKPGNIAFDEEIFGPIMTLIHAADENEAIQLANHTKYGLGAAVFTRNHTRGEEIARYKLKAGTCAVNTLIRSNPNLPFGGIKHSGYGRELSFEGLISFMNIKTILLG